MKKQNAEMASATKEPEPMEKRSPDLDIILYDATLVRGLLQMFNEAMSKELDDLRKLEPNSAYIELAIERYENVISSTLWSALIVINEIIDDLGEVDS